MSKKLKLFLESFLVFGLGGVINKIIPLIMVPIITRLLPDTSVYGLSDLCSTIISFGGAFAMLGMYDALFRLFFEKEDLDYRKSICSTTFVILLCSSIFIFVVLVLGRNILSIYAFKDSQYTYLVLIAAVGTLFHPAHSIFSTPTRMQNKKKTYLAINISGSIIAYVISIIIILLGYYTIALPLGSVISCIIIAAVYYFINSKWFSFRCFKKNLVKPLLKIGLPLVPTFLIYWVFDSCDKLMISNMMDVAQEGIYAVGAKLGHCSQIIFIAFTGGWQYFAFSTMKDKNQVETNSKIFEYLFAITALVSVYVFAIAKPLFHLLFEGNYIKGYIVAPYLFMAPLVQMLFNVSSNQYIIEKKSWPISLILFVGALFNVIINYILIPVLGIEGAAIASLIGYSISTILCMVLLVNKKKMILSFKTITVFCTFIFYVFLWRFVIFDKTVPQLVLSIAFSILIAFLYRSDVQKIIHSMRKNR